MKLNWRDASKELPDQLDENGNSKLCLIVFFHNNNPHYNKDWVNRYTKKWMYSDGADIKYWIYLDEIPLPEE